MSEVGTHTEWVCPSLTVDNGSVPVHELPGLSDGLDEQAWSTAGTTGTSMSSVVPRASSWRRVSMISRGEQIAEVAQNNDDKNRARLGHLRAWSPREAPGSQGHFATRPKGKIRVGKQTQLIVRAWKIGPAALRAQRLATARP